MKIVAFSGSPRLNGNTNYLVDCALEEASKVGIETVKFPLYRYKIQFCCGQDGCRRDFVVCSRKDDAPKLLTELYSADGIILATPVYFHNVSAQLKAFIDRNRFNLYRRIRFKATTAGFILAATRGGLQDADNALTNFFKLCSRIPPERIFRVHTYASRLGDILQKRDAIEQARQMGRDMAERLFNPLPVDESYKPLGEEVGE